MSGASYLGLRTVLDLAQRLPTARAVPSVRRSLDDLLVEGDEVLSSPWLEQLYRDDPASAHLDRLAWLRTARHFEVRRAVRTYLGDAADVVLATRPDDYLAALRRAAQTTDGPPRGEVGWSWDSRRFPGEDLEARQLRWQPGDPIDMPRPRAKDYPPWDTGRPRAYRNIAHFELQRRLGRTFDGSRGTEPLWNDLSSAQLRSTESLVGDEQLSLAELLVNHEHGYAPRVGGVFQSGRPAPASLPTERCKLEARAELRARYRLEEIRDGTRQEIEAVLPERREPARSARPTRFAELGDDELLRIVDDGTPPFDLITAELEHAGGVQRGVRRLEEALGDELSLSEMRRLCGLCDSDNLLLVDPMEHAFFDHFARTTFGRPNPARADRDGAFWGAARDLELSRLYDERAENPFALLPDRLLRPLHEIVLHAIPNEPLAYRRVLAWLDQVAAAREH
ncbi:MAG: hypothetical protein AAGC60_01420 [Acidobacteriota bacterium]